MKLDAQHRIILSPLIDSKESHMGVTSAYKENKHTSADQLTASLSDSQINASFRHQRKRKNWQFSLTEVNMTTISWNLMFSTDSPYLRRWIARSLTLELYVHMKETNTPEQNNWRLHYSIHKIAPA
jgi:hypothetical protein